MILPNTIYKISGLPIRLYYDQLPTISTAVNGIYPFANYLKINKDGAQFTVTIDGQVVTIVPRQQVNLNKRVLLIGDSIFARGDVTNRLQELDTSLTIINEGRGGWKAYDFARKDESPFRFNEALDFNQYLNGAPPPDVVVIHLGINDVFGYTDDAVAALMITKSRQYIEELLAILPCPVIQCLPIAPAASQDGFALRYGTAQTLGRYQRNRDMLIAEYTCNLSTTQLHSNHCIDPHYDFETVEVDGRVMVNDPIHPTVQGMNKLADVIYAHILGMF